MNDGSGGDLILWLTGALVLIAAYYAWETRQMAREMRKARNVQVLPRLALDLHRLGAGNVLLRVENAGVGPALDVDVRISLRPGGVERRLKVPLISQGEVRDFIPDPTPEAPNGRIHLDTLTAAYEDVRLSGTYRDALGEEHSANDVLDLREYWRLSKEANETLPEDAMEKVAKPQWKS